MSWHAHSNTGCHTEWVHSVAFHSTPPSTRSPQSKQKFHCRRHYAAAFLLFSFMRSQVTRFLTLQRNQIHRRRLNIHMEIVLWRTHSACGTQWNQLHWIRFSSVDRTRRDFIAVDALLFHNIYGTRGNRCRRRRRRATANHRPLELR